MTLKTVFIERPPQERERHEVEDVLAFLVRRFGQWPADARLYHGALTSQNDVTPSGDGAEINAQVAHVQGLPGPFWVATHPGDPGSALSIVGLTLFNWAVGALLQPKPDAPQIQNRRATSPNNELANRTNRVRIGERIEDIFGQVRAIPSLIAQPYKFYEANTEFEFAAFCLGRGKYQFDEIPRDGDTPVTDIEGVKVNAFDPGSNPNAGDSPDHSWGGTIGRKIDIVSRTASINGQTLEAPNARVVEAPSGNGFDYVVVSGSATTGTGRISCEDSDVDLEGVFNGVSSVSLTGGPTDFSGIPITVDGTYDVVGTGTDGVGHTYVDLDLSSEASADWGFGGTKYEQQLGTLASEDSVEIGPFSVGDSSSTRLSINYVALNGLYKSDGEKQTRQSIAIRATVSKAGETDETFDHTLTGSSVLQETIGETDLIEPSFSGPYEVRFERLTDTDRREGFQVVDEVKVRDLYALAPSTKTTGGAFGDVTTLTAQTQATAGALAVRERQLNILVTRLVDGLGAAPDFTPADPGVENLGSRRFRDILTVVARKVCGLETDEIDWPNLSETWAEIVDYFGFDAPAEFSYTFDDLSLSAEETLQAVARAVFCTAYRDPDDGGKLKFRFEKPQTDGRLLFNHRNTVPGSVVRTTRFGTEDDHDGVEVFFINAETDQQDSVTLPVGASPVHPRRERIIGLRGDEKVATLHAWRIWQKLQYANTRDDREVTDEAALLLRGNRVEIADGARSETQAGEVVFQNGLTLEISQDADFENGVDYVIILQHADGSTESLAVSAGDTPREVVLGSAPKASLALDDDRWARALYWIIKDDDDQRGRGFLVETLSPSGPRGHRRQLTAVNYDSRYYSHDKDYA